MDHRLRAAVDASRAWYDDIFAAHGLPFAVADGLWSAQAEPPRWHSAAKTTRPGVAPARVLAAVEGLPHCSVADSFGDLDLAPGGFDLLFEATWLHRPPARAANRMPEGWSVVADEALLARWNAAADTAGVLLPSLLAHPRFTFLARVADGVPDAGAVLHDAGAGTIGLSNVWELPGIDPDPTAVLRCVAVLHPGRALTDYARGSALDAMLAVGFSALGPQLVWAR